MWERFYKTFRMFSNLKVPLKREILVYLCFDFIFLIIVTLTRFKLGAVGMEKQHKRCIRVLLEVCHFVKVYY